MTRWLLLSFLWLAACSSGSGSSSQSNGDPDPGPPGPVADIIGTIAGQGEIEPNDSVGMALALIVPTPGPTDDFIGFVVDGNVTEQTDTRDTFAFSTTRSRTFSFQLCQPGCLFPLNGESVDVSVAYFEILDQSGTLLASTQGDVGGDNYLEIYIDAGVLYHAMVRTEDTMSGTQSYSLIGIEIF